MVGSATVAAVDPFDLPDWLGTAEVTWTARSSSRGSHLVTGELSADTAGTEGADHRVPCDLMAVDLAYPAPPLDEHWRREAHQAWTHGQVLLVEHTGRLTLLVPGTEFSADRVLESLARLAKAVGVQPARFVAALRL